MLGTKLRLQPELDVEKDKANLVERYVDGFPHLQRRLLALMDSWCQSSCDIRVVARRYPQATAWRLERLSPERWCSRSCACCSATAWTQNCVPMRPPCGTCATCGRVERSTSRESWVDHVWGLVGPSEWLQEQLLQLLASHGDVATTARCALDLVLPEERLPATVATELSRLRLQDRTAEVPSEDTKDCYYKLPIAREDVHFLAS